MLIVKGGDLVVQVVVCDWLTRIGPAVAAVPRVHLGSEPRTLYTAEARTV